MTDPSTPSPSPTHPGTPTNDSPAPASHSSPSRPPGFGGGKGWRDEPRGGGWREKDWKGGEKDESANWRRGAAAEKEKDKEDKEVGWRAGNPEDSVGAVTIQYDPAIKHPLQRSWTLWFDATMKKSERSSVQNEWNQGLKEVLTVSTIEDFWGLYNSIEAASTLSNGCNYHFFQKGIRPAWEDKANEKGGLWRYAKKRTDLDQKWVSTLLACIGEAFPAPHQICGAVVSLKQNGGDRVSLWISDATDEANVDLTGKFFKEQVLDSDSKITFVPHEPATKKYEGCCGRHDL
uniref:Uncharacterized protein n=1 Tax=Paramoeba aestuarina TaxID=180227 RepID=A0A7S4PC61_9EUKA